METNFNIFALWNVGEVGRTWPHAGFIFRYFPGILHHKLHDPTATRIFEKPSRRGNISHVFKCGCVWKCRVPLKPMVLLIIIPINKWLFHWEYTQHFQVQTHVPYCSILLVPLAHLQALPNCVLSNLSSSCPSFKVPFPAKNPARYTFWVAAISGFFFQSWFWTPKALERSPRILNTF